VVQIYGLLTKLVWSRWLVIGQVHFYMFIDGDGVKVHKLVKKEQSSHLDQTSLVNNGFTIWLLGKLFLRDTAGSPEWAR